MRPVTSDPASSAGADLASVPAGKVRAGLVARHYLPGGRENGGGIGRLVGYIVDEAARSGRRHVVVDTRGAAISVLSPFRLGSACLVMIRDRLADPGCIQHIHVAGRGSTVRKLVLAGVARAIGSRHVIHLHDPEYGDDIARRPVRVQRAIARMFRGADHAVALGGRDRALMVERLGVAPDRASVLHNAVPDPGEPHPRGTAPGPVRILFLGRLSERKGVPELIAALAGAEMRGLDWRAVLAGDGPVEAYRADAARAGIGARVEMPGWVGEAAVRALCSEADILVLPSHAEGMAMAMLEGMAHGLTVVTTRVGAHEEVMDDGVSGVFVPPGDPAALAATLAALVRDPARRAQLGRGARVQFEAALSIAAYARGLDRLYAELADPVRRQPQAAAGAEARTPIRPTSQ